MIADAEFLERFDADGAVRSVVDAVRASLPPDAGAAMAYMARPHLVFDIDELIRHIQFCEAVHDVRQRDNPTTKSEP